MGDDARGEGGHDVAIVVRDDPLEGGYGSLDRPLRDEAEDPELGEAAVVDLHDEPLLLLLGGHLGATEGLVEVERTPRDVLGVEGGEVSDLTPAHVVSSGLALAPLSRC